MWLKIAYLIPLDLIFVLCEMRIFVQKPILLALFWILNEGMYASINTESSHGKSSIISSPVVSSMVLYLTDLILSPLGRHMAY